MVFPNAEPQRMVRGLNFGLKKSTYTICLEHVYLISLLSFLSGEKKINQNGIK